MADATLVGLVQYSTGTASAEVGVRALPQYDRIVLLTADTLVEDDDNWRFAEEAWRWLGRPEWVKLTDGRTPMQVGRDHRCVPNNRMAVCSRVLKRELLRWWIEANYTPTTAEVLEGYDWTEVDRFDAARPHWAADGWTLRAPLMDKPHLSKPDIFRLWRDRGIREPRLYETGAPHANCGGACVRGGQVEWRRLLFSNRPRYLEWEAEEEVSRAMLGKDVAILRHRSGPRDGEPLSLREYRETLDRQPSMFDAADEGACGCKPDDPTLDGVPVKIGPKVKAERRTDDGWVLLDLPPRRPAKAAVVTAGGDPGHGEG